MSRKSVAQIEKMSRISVLNVDIFSDTPERRNVNEKILIPIKNIEVVK